MAHLGYVVFGRLAIPQRIAFTSSCGLVRMTQWSECKLGKRISLVLLSTANYIMSQVTQDMQPCKLFQHGREF